MSKVGKKPIDLPAGVTCSIINGELTVKGNKGELKSALSNKIVVENKDNKITVSPKDSSIEARKFWGTFRALINNMVLGVTNGFTKSLEITGVGYRVNVKGDKLVMQLGLSHDVELKIPEGITIVCPTNTQVNVSGIDKQKVGLIASLIKKHKKPEPYKGKGFKYVGEKILRKEGKKK